MSWTQQRDKKPMGFFELYESYGRSSGKSKRLAARQSFVKAVPTPASSPTIKISPPTPTKEMASNLDQVQFPKA